VETCFGLALFGITVSQAYTYSLMASRDPILIKAAVISVVILEISTSVFNVHLMYYHLIQNFGNPAPLAFIVWSAKGAAVTIIATVIVARFFNIYRVYQLTHHNLNLTIAVATVSVTGIAVGFVGSTVNVLKSDTWSQFSGNKTTTVTLIMGLVLSALDDILIASILIHCLTKMKTGVIKTDHLITKIIIYVVNTGVMTAIISLLTVFLYVFMKDSFIFQGAYVLAGRVYGVAVIGSLTQRQHIITKDSLVITDGDMPISDFVASTRSISRRPIEIFQDVHLTVDRSSAKVDLELKHDMVVDCTVGVESVI